VHIRYSRITDTGHGNIAWTAETLRTVAQLEQQARHVRDLLPRQSQNPTSQAICQLISQLAVYSTTILAEENTKLWAASQRQRRKRDQRRQYIASARALQHHQCVVTVTFKDTRGLQVDQDTLGTCKKPFYYFMLL
jgi:hypothetical protein